MKLQPEGRTARRIAFPIRLFVTALFAVAVAAAPASAAAAAQDKASSSTAAAAAPSEAAQRVLRWILRSGDNRGLPFAVVDKPNATLLLFDGGGEEIGRAPVLVGIAPGDDSSPGVGSKQLAELGPLEKTTPAGRFLAKFGLAAGRKQVLWVDYPNAVALHPVVTTNRKERRLERIASPAAEDNRITFGCINVPVDFYGKQIRPLFGKRGGMVYVLPDTKPLEEVFPGLLAERYL